MLCSGFCGGVVFGVLKSHLLLQSQAYICMN